MCGRATAASRIERAGCRCGRLDRDRKEPGGWAPPLVLRPARVILRIGQSNGRGAQPIPNATGAPKKLRGITPDFQKVGCVGTRGAHATGGDDGTTGLDGVTGGSPLAWRGLARDHTDALDDAGRGPVEEAKPLPAGSGCCYGYRPVVRPAALNPPAKVEPH